MLLGVTRRTEQEVEAIESLEKVFIGFDFEEETGLPAIAQQFGPADGSGPPEGW